jgi:hypothetical protein
MKVTPEQALILGGPHDENGHHQGKDERCRDDAAKEDAS